MHLYKTLTKAPFGLTEKYIVADDYFSVEEKYPSCHKIRLIQKDIDIIKETSEPLEKIE